MSTITEKKSQSYFREVQNELKKVTWTAKGELLFCTKVVILSVFLFGLTIYAADLGIRAALDMVGALVRMIFG